MKNRISSKVAIICFLILILSVKVFGQSASSDYPELPYAASNYDENYRGQFHFSPKGGWVNDVNGIWYYGGVYHLSYQHYPHGLDWGPMHWGHATSPDMIHWTQQPIMLEPGVNVPGDCWSGSTVVDTDNTSGFKTGANPVFVTIYTATTKGTCLAYSNDLGATWQAYSGNNVNVGGPDQNTRDPHVFWYAPTSKWVCMLYENGTTIYTSPDLKNWTKVSNYSFGFECPDFFELPVDGGATKKWVIQDASGKYHIGDFNGTVFTPTDIDGPYKMDVGPDFYAAQTFYRPTFPDNRLIQIAWLDTWNGGTETTPWRREFTFPVELKLVTTAAGIRIARYPISEISTLYSSTINWDSQILSQGSDLLSGVGSKTFDMTYEFDLQNTTATSINLRIANKTITYDVKNQTLLGKPLPAISNKIKIRVLADWGQLEVFGNDGIFSWSEQVAFTPSDWTVSLTANGDLNLVAATFSNVNRTWPGTVPFVHVTGVSLNNTSNVLSLGTKFKIKPVIEPLNAPNKVVTWSSSNTSVATVNSMGEVTAVALGTATITVTTVDAAKTATCSITVVPTPNYQVYDFESGDLTDWNVISGTAFSNADVCSDATWGWGGPFIPHGTYHMWGYKGSGDASVGEMKTSNFTIAADGKIKFLIGGGLDSTNLYIGLYRASDDALLMKEVGDNDEGYTEKTFDAYSYLGTQCYLKVVDKATSGWGHINLDWIRIPLSGPVISVTGVSVLPSTATISAAGATQQLDATVEPSDASNQAVIWSSGNTAVATVNASGLVTGVANGSTTITATTQDGSHTATCDVTVSFIIIPVTSVAVSPTTASISVGTSQQLTAAVAPVNASNKIVTWSSGDTSVATVNTSGLVTGLAEGVATITVTTQDGTKTAICAVTVTPFEGIVPGIYKIVARHSGKAMDSDQGQSVVQQWDYLGGENQKWNVIPTSPAGYYTISSVNGGKVIDSDGSANGAKIQVWTDLDGDNQKWQIEDVGNGYFKIVSKIVSERAIEVSSSSLNNGSQLKLADYTGGTQQQWSFVLLEVSTSLESAIDLNNKVVVFPVPAKDIFTIDLTPFHHDKDVNIVITDIFGKMITNIKATDLKYSISSKNLGMNSGMYFINIKSENRSSVVKMIIE